MAHFAIPSILSCSKIQFLYSQKIFNKGSKGNFSNLIIANFIVIIVKLDIFNNLVIFL